MRARRVDHRPKPRQRMLTLDRGFLVGIGLVVVLAWWLRGDEPPGLAGEPDLRSFRGAPLLLVYGAPGCSVCERQWRELQPTLPLGLQVLHLAARAGDGDPRPATPEVAQRWARTLQLPTSEVLPAHLPTRRLPALLLRNERGRWRFEHTGRLDAEARQALLRAFEQEGLSTRAVTATTANPAPNF